MKRGLICALALCLLLSATAQASGCDYFDLYGVHDWYQSDAAYATCETDGYYVLKCSYCGITEKYITDHATGHQYYETGAHKDPTCTAEGWHTMRCANCGDEVTFTLKKLEHSWADTGAGQEPTCQDAGWRVEECLVCGAERTVSLKKTDHVWNPTGYGEPSTCVTQGYAEEECLYCGQIRTYLLPLGEHDFGPWMDIVPATDHSMGTRGRECAVCGAQESEDYYPEGTIYRGCPKGEDVRQAQQMLIDLLLLNDRADGVFGKRTEAAVASFQQLNDLNVDGIGWPQTLSALTAAWNAAMTPAGADTQGDPPTACVRWDDGARQTCDECCGRHAELVQREAALYEEGCTREDLVQLAADWEAALTELYDEWAARRTDVAAVDAIQGARARFLECLDRLDDADTGFDAMAALERRVQALRAETVRLCGLLAVAYGDSWTMGEEAEIYYE